MHAALAGHKCPVLHQQVAAIDKSDWLKVVS